MNGIPIMENPLAKYSSVNGREANNTLDTLSQTSKNAYVARSKL